MSAELSEARREALAEALSGHWQSSDPRTHEATCGCHWRSGEHFLADAEGAQLAWSDHLTAALAPLVAGWIAEERERIAADSQIESTAAKVHEAWMDAKRAQGVTSRPSEWGEEQMVPYADLTERAKDLDRSTVKAVFAALRADRGDA